MLFKKSLKALRDTAVAAVGPHRWPVKKPVLLILTYHRVLPPEHPDLAFEQPGMVVHPSTLDMHLREVQRYFEPVRLSEWLKRAEAGEPLPSKAVAITFDDGWRDNATWALPVLEAHGIPATLFVVSDYVQSGATFWPERLGWLLTQTRTLHGPDSPLGKLLQEPLRGVEGAPTALDVDRCITHLKARYDDDALIAMLDEVEATAGAGPQPSVVDEAELRAMLASGLIDIGSHTLSHKRLTADVPEAEAERQVAGSKQALERLTGAAVELFCYPNGDISPAAEALARRHYTAAVTTRGGRNRQPVDPYNLQRFNMHEGASGTRRQFISRISGWV